MPFDVARLDGSKWDGTVICYFFRVSNGVSSKVVAVRIPEQTFFGVGEAKIGEEVWELAEDWLRIHLDEKFNPFSQPPSGSLPIVPLAFADDWICKKQRETR